VSAIKTQANESGALQWSAAEIGALAHLYRGEMYRSKVWRARLDGTTNWAVGTTGIGLSVTFSNPENSPLTLILVAFLVLVFLSIEARRYRYFDIWRTRVRVMETSFFGPMLRGEGVNTSSGWNQALAHDYENLRFHISFVEAFGRRLRRNYAWIFLIIGLSFLAKLAIHPTALSSPADLWARASAGPVSGKIVMSIGTVLYLVLFLIGFASVQTQHASGRVHGPQDQDPLAKFEMHG
jgi:uncharacterized membrane protein